MTIRSSATSSAGPLVARGHDVTLEADGAAGVAALAQASFDLVITDIFMPGQDGIVTVLHIRDAELLGATGSLRKPFTPAQLMALVDKVL